MNCQGVRSAIASWRNAGTLKRRDFVALSDHIAVCEECRVRYRLIVPLIRRDVSGAVGVTADAAEPDEAFTQGVMDGIQRGIRPFRRRLPTPSFRRLIPAAAAAAVLLLAAGIYVRGIAGTGQSGEVTVRFVLDAPGAQAVSLVGSFNAWNPDSLPLRRATGSQEWEVSVRLQRGETYLYNFVVNGNTWIPDPTTDLQVEDGFGGESSLMQL